MKRGSIITVKRQKPARTDLYRLSTAGLTCHRVVALHNGAITADHTAARNRELWRADRRGRLLPPRYHWPCLGRVMISDEIAELTWRDVED